MPEPIEEARLAVLGDRAQELGFECPPGLTPAWGLDLDAVRYGEPPTWLSREVWDREIRLWAADCVDEVRSLWEEWAHTHLPGRIHVAREAIQASRVFARGEIGFLEYVRVAREAYLAAHQAALVQHGSVQARHAVSAAGCYRAPPEMAWYARMATVEGLRGVTLSSQRRMLASRLDLVAPWRFMDRQN